MPDAGRDSRNAALAALSHDLRSPLNGIIGFADLLKDGTAGPLTERQRLYVGNILVSAQTLLALINRALDAPEAAREP